MTLIRTSTNKIPKYVNINTYISISTLNSHTPDIDNSLVSIICHKYKLT